MDFELVGGVVGLIALAIVSGAAAPSVGLRVRRNLFDPRPPGRIGSKAVPTPLALKALCSVVVTFACCVGLAMFLPGAAELWPALGASAVVSLQCAAVVAALTTLLGPSALDWLADMVPEE